MKKGRRNFLKSSIAAGGLGLISPAAALASKTPDLVRPKVIFFDVNETLLDLEPLKTSINAALGNKPGLSTLWFTTMLHYSLVVTSAGQYQDFGKIGAAALQMVARNNNFDLTDDQALKAVKPILNLQPHPEVILALEMLKKSGYRLVSFTNSSEIAVKTQLEFAGLASYFEKQLSIESIGKFKPHRDAYDWAARIMKIENAECFLIAAHGWDVAGANWAGWKSGFIARPGQQLFPLAPVPEILTKDLMLMAERLIQL